MKIICECGLAWETFDDAIQYCDTAKEIGADFIKFQIVENKDLPQLRLGEWKVVKHYCNRIGIEFLATPSSYEITRYLREELNCDIIKIGSDHVNDEWIIKAMRNLGGTYILSDGYYNVDYYKRVYSNSIKMYCVSLYPCEPRFIGWNIKGYQGFSDHTQLYDLEWANKIKAKGFKYYEKHLTLGFNKIDEEVSLTKDQFKILIGYLK